MLLCWRRAFVYDCCVGGVHLFVIFALLAVCVIFFAPQLQLRMSLDFERILLRNGKAVVCFQYVMT